MNTIIEDLLEKNKKTHIDDPDDWFPIAEVQDVMDELRIKSANQDLEKLISNMNSDQQRVFNFVKSKLNSHDTTPMRHFVSGVGGTGKSYLIKTVKAFIENEIKKDVAVTAPTGISAFNIQGMTVHRLLQLPVEHGNTPPYRPLSNNVLKIIRQAMENVILIIIDEITMISNITLTYINLRLCEIFDTGDINDGLDEYIY